MNSYTVLKSFHVILSTQVPFSHKILPPNPHFFEILPPDIWEQMGKYLPLQSYIPILKALICAINPVGAQGCGCIFTFCHAYLKMGVLLHKEASRRFIMILAVDPY